MVSMPGKTFYHLEIPASLGPFLKVPTMHCCCCYLLLAVFFVAVDVLGRGVFANVYDWRKYRAVVLCATRNDRV